MIVENEADIVAIVETENLDVQGIIHSLKLQSQDWQVSEICPEADIKVLTRSNVHISVHREDKNFATYKYLRGKKFSAACSSFSKSASSGRMCT